MYYYYILYFVRNAEMIATKLIVYTRQSYLFGMLPSVFSHTDNLQGSMELLLKNVIFEDLESLKMLKVSLDTPEGEISKEIASFIDNGRQKVFVLIANMQDLTAEMVNYLRIVIEQKESRSLFDDKMFVLLLHFPQVQFFNRCYPALFLNGWDHFYLDSLTTDIKMEGIPEPLRNVVDIKQCFRIALGISDSNNALSLHLEPLLEVAIPVISSRVITGCSQGEYNKTIKVSARQLQLRKIFFINNNCTPIGEAFCTLFHKYWDNKTVIKFLKDAANFTFRHQSTLSITSYIQTRIKALFFEFVVYVLWMINQDCNLDTLLSMNLAESFEKVQNLFSSVIKTMFKKLQSLKSLPYICRSLCPPDNKNFQFPFFSMAYLYVEELIDVCHEIVNKRKRDPTASFSPKATKEILEREMFEEMKKKLQKLLDVSSHVGMYNVTYVSNRSVLLCPLKLQSGLTVIMQ